MGADGAKQGKEGREVRNETEGDNVGVRNDRLQTYRAVLLGPH